jgi:hypothetical protein
MANSVDLKDLLTLTEAIELIRGLLVSAVAKDHKVKSDIAAMTDEEIIDYARNTCERTDQAAGNFIDKHESA